MTPRRLIAATALASGAGLSWALLEARSYRMRFVVAAVLRPGAEPRRLLHVSDLHLTPTQSGKRHWVQRLARWEPDLVVVTGDFLAHRHAVAVALDALGPVGQFPGAFVLGSNDYLAPKPFNPAQYLRGPSGIDESRDPLPWGDLVAGLRGFGWNDLSNRAEKLSLDGWTVDARGVDDPHIGLDDYAQVAGAFAPDVDLRLGVSHAPYLRVVDAMADDGADLVLAGHTHGGQLCLPGAGALVTNCDLPTRYAKGLHSYRSAPDAPAVALHVSAGLGTSPHAPVRFACPPEATLLTLVGRPADL